MTLQMDVRTDGGYHNMPAFPSKSGDNKTYFVKINPNRSAGLIS